ncbi:MAG: ABC transporter ATP-binding protein, partial [Candidatus Hydrogenedentes bacterium]|nr:ABC transporter ATP-binding protein [Candidatus Hydrogenedentota bacterium]
RNNPVICIRNMSFSYSTKEILSNINLDIYNGEFVSVIGPNGAGKTTLLKIILGILHPQKGEIKVLGKKPEEARDKIGYVPQHSLADLSFPASALEVVLMGLVTPLKLFWFTKKDKERAVETLEIVGMEKFADSHFSDLSGGQRQRVLIARALISNPEILLFDEPTAHIDALAEAELMTLLKKLSSMLTVIIVSHDIGFVSQFVDTVVCVNRTIQKHPKSALSGAIIDELYGRAVEFVHHTKSHPEESHDHE